MPLAFYLDFATKQKGLRQAIDSKGLLSPNIVSLFCRPLPPSDNKGKDSAAIKQILHSYFIECTNLESPNEQDLSPKKKPGPDQNNCLGHKIVTTSCENDHFHVIC